MSERATGSKRGKWLAIALVTAGVIAALAEWKFRARPPARRTIPVATQPAEP